MTWTYNLALTADKDKVRLLVEDTDTDDQLAQDEEINFLLIEAGGSIYRAAAAICLSAKRRNLPVSVFGSCATNSIARGYLYGAIACLTWSCSACASTASPGAPLDRTT